MSNWAAELILLARRKARLTQRELARRANTSQAAIAEYEAGRRSPSLDNLARVVRAAGSDLRIRLEPLDAHDDWVRAYESRLPPEVLQAWRERDRALIASAGAEGTERQRPRTRKKRG